jgi:hypothetical protein
MKSLLELAELEIKELEYVIEHKEDMPDYMHDFEKYTAKDILHVMKSLVKQNKELIAKQQPITIRRRIAG